MITLSLLRSVEHFSAALSLPCSAACPSMDCETGEKLALSAGEDLGGIGGMDAVLSAVQGILNPLIAACKYLIANVLATEHTTQHTKAAGFWGDSTRASRGFQTGGEGVEVCARLDHLKSIGGLKIYWHCLVHETAMRVGEVGLTSCGLIQVPNKKKKGRRGALRGRVVTAGETATFNNNTHDHED